MTLPTPGDRTRDLNAITAIIRTVCPTLHIKSIALLGQGDFCTAYLVNDSRVFRFARHHDAVNSLRREACLLPRLASRFDVRIPVPDVAHLHSDLPFVAYPLLAGPALTRERYLHLAEAEREHCATQLARFVARLHTADLTLAHGCDVPTADYRGAFGGLLPRAHHHLFRIVGPPVQSFVETTITAFVESQGSMTFPLTLLHGDLSPDHVLYDPNGPTLTGVIDFGDACVGDAAWDLVFLYEDYGLDFLRRFVRAYRPGGAGPLLERMFRLWVLAAIEWAVQCAGEESAALPDAIGQLVSLRENGQRLLEEVLATGAADV